MHRIHFLLITALLAMAAVVVTTAQEAPTDKVTVALSDPARPATVRASLMHGGITVKGYAGKEILVEARSRGDRHARREREAPRGMRRIQIGGTGLTVTEENNVVSVNTTNMHGEVDLLLQVPARSSLKLTTMNDGDIVVEGEQGEIEVNNMNDEVKLSGISGSAVVHAMNGDIEVVFSAVDPQKTMSFSTMNGNIDVTLPATTRANAVIRADNGDVFTDFDIVMDPAPRQPAVEDARGKGGKFKVKFDKTLTGKINGGGPEFHFKTFNGDIFIRKSTR